MKNYRIFLFIIAFIMAIGMIVSGVLVFSVSYEKPDVTEMNEIAGMIKSRWNDLDSLKKDDFDTEIKVFDTENYEVLSFSNTNLNEIDSVIKASAEGCMVIPVDDNGKTLGYVVLPNSINEKLIRIRVRLIITGSVMMLILIGAFASYGLYINKRVVRPFRKLEQFSVLIAQGNLDEPLLIEKNNLFGEFTECFDIMREELKKAKKKETELKVREKEMIASLSHDLKTPVTGIRLICELLSVKFEDEYAKDKIGQVYQKAEQISVLVNDLLSSALDDLGEMTVSCSDENSEILHELILCHDTRLLVSEETIPECLLNIDRNRFSQVIGNIISNSYKYSQTKIDVSYRINGRFLEMSIKDYGDGVSQDELMLITNKYYRGKENSAGKDGSGLGLYISSLIMEKMGGELICSCPEKGLVVTLMIPLS